MAAAPIQLFSKENGIDVIKECFNKTRYSTYAEILSREDMLIGKTVPEVARSYRAAAGRACGKVNPAYASASFNQAFRNPAMDMLVVRLKTKGSYSVVLGFVIPQLGECRMLPNTWSINLICGSPMVEPKSASAKDKAVALAKTEELGSQAKGIGGFLLAATMLAAKRYYARENIQPAEMILELAGSYGNPAGLTSYTKLGFVKDLSLFYAENPQDCLSWNTRNCFCEENTLPMKSNLDLLSEEDLKSILIETYNYRNILDNESSGMLNASRNIFKSSAGKKLDEAEKKAIETKTNECAALTNSMLSIEKNIANLQNRRDRMGMPIDQDKLREHREALDRVLQSQRACLGEMTQIADDLRLRPAPAAVAAPAAPVPAPVKKRKEVEQKDVEEEKKEDRRPRTRAYVLRSKSGSRCGASSDWDYSGMRELDMMHRRSRSRSRSHRRYDADMDAESMMRRRSRSRSRSHRRAVRHMLSMRDQDARREHMRRDPRKYKM